MSGRTEERSGDGYAETPVQSVYSGEECFFCGRQNPVGTRLSFARVEGPHQELVCRWRPDGRYKGLGRVLHGGIQSGLFDEIMGWTAHHFGGGPGVTTQIQVRFLGPLYVDQDLELRCRVAGRQGRRVNLEAWLCDQQGRRCAEAQGTYMLMDEDKFFALVGLDRPV